MRYTRSFASPLGRSVAETDDGLNLHPETRLARLSIFGQFLTASKILLMYWGTTNSATNPLLHLPCPAARFEGQRGRSILVHAYSGGARSTKRGLERGVEGLQAANNARVYESPRYTSSRITDR